MLQFLLFSVDMSQDPPLIIYMK